MWQDWTKVVYHYWFSSVIWAKAVIRGDQNEERRTRSIFIFKGSES
jgi:hypothetical protein